jgi:excisionase family DNA binding protein
MATRDWTTSELAEQAGLTQNYVRREILAGRLQAIKRGRDWFISDKEARRWLALHPSPRHKEKDKPIE